MRMRSKADEQHTAEARFSEAELSAVLDRALERQREADARRQEIARSLNLPEEHVRAAAEEIVRRRQRERRLPLVRARRKKQALLAAVVLGVPALLLALKGALLPAVLLVLPLLYFGWRALAGPVTEADAERAEPLPVAGTCRVCGEPTVNPRSTFCETHRYKGPG